MKKLTKRDEERRTEIIAALESASSDVDTALDEINALIDEKLAPAIEAYNEAVTSAEGLRDDIVSAIDEYTAGRSDKWRDGDKGTAFENWKSEWENLDCTAIDVVAKIEIGGRDHANDLDGLPTEPTD